ncbi:hypothetical protein [Pyrococcus yayanosii]|uniref:Uncharacterized protein n=1 Tax=Pyrococcus yayanosii (strain CH1 / JCM 16557) TaxID=529709 RepID=F8AEL1_PYRYC|nr:hypothetical protein [Pyrococcus yayanosii]AEH24690.1 hypothetical protein PYCH_10070 [Pyrococcus yayanosii CH1]
MKNSKLLVASASLLIALTAYGRTESFYMSSESGIFYAIIYNLLFLLPTATALLLLMISADRKRKTASACLYALFLTLYVASLRYVNSKSALFSLPNPLPEVFSWFGDKIPVFTYHFLLFDLGFPCLILSLALLIDGKLLRSFLHCLVHC